MKDNLSGSLLHDEITTIEEVLMECNVGRRESQLRVAGGIILAVISAFAPIPRPVKFALRAWGLAQISSGFTRYCPSNALFKINNCRRKPGEKFIEALS
jgi:hypothetical protein